MDRAVVGDVVTVIAKGRRKERHQPDRVNTEILQVIQFLGETSEVPNPIPIAVVKSPDMDLVDDCVLVPQRVLEDGQEFSPKTCAAMARDHWEWT